MQPMKLGTLLSAMTTDPVTATEGTAIQHIRFNSKHVQPGDLFVAIKGYEADGHNYIQDAIEAGAAAIVGEMPTSAIPASKQFPYFQVDNARQALALLAARRFNYPSRRHTMVGVTGTNGKTTTAHWLRHILAFSGESCAMASTLEQVLNGKTLPSVQTTHDAVQTQSLLYQSRDKHVVMEVSSHGLAQHRLDGTAFDLALFTNLSEEHLDYHSSLEAYFSTKMRLFELLKDRGEAIVNIDCPWGRKAAKSLKKKGTPMYTYGIGQHDASINVTDITPQLQPSFTIQEGNENHSFRMQIPGMHNVSNAAAAVLAARRLNLPYTLIRRAVAAFKGVPGRLETFTHPNGAVFIVDYAHTPEGLQQCLKTVSVYGKRRLKHIFGFRGGRHHAKWKRMVEISNQFCDQTILTLDDLNQVGKVSMLAVYHSLTNTSTSVIEDRTLAISSAWEAAQPEDCVMITGKGPEHYQQKFALSATSDRSMLQMLCEQETQHSSDYA